MLSELQGRADNLSENVNKEIENIKTEIENMKKNHCIEEYNNWNEE